MKKRAGGAADLRAVLLPALLLLGAAGGEARRVLDISAFAPAPLQVDVATQESDLLSGAPELAPGPAAAPAPAPAAATDSVTAASAAVVPAAALPDARGVKSSGRIPEDVVDFYTDAELGKVNAAEWVTITLSNVTMNITIWGPDFPLWPLATGKPSPPPPPAATVLNASYLFYEAQRSGQLPADNRVTWRRSAHVNDVVPGGWYDAGDYIKHALTIGQSATFIAWSAIDFKDGHVAASQLGHAQAAVKWAADYLRACHRQAAGEYVGLIGNPDIDHTFWGRGEEQTGERPVYVWNRTMPASDLLGTVSASLASASVLLRSMNATDADDLRRHAEELYQWGAAVPGLYSKSLPGYPWVYSSTRYHDKLMLAAGWLYRATGNASYLAAAYSHWQQAGGFNGGSVSPYVSWDAVWPPAAVQMLGIAQEIGSANVPGHGEYLTFVNDFRDIYLKADGRWGIVKTPKGLRLADWSQWGNLRYAGNVAFTMLLRAKQLMAGGQDRNESVAFARSQIDYALGSTGRSYVVGWGLNPPQRVHHAGASCPNPPATCTWAEFSSPNPNPQVLYGALVAGPAGPGDDTYKDERNDYVTNEVAIDYNAGFTGALAGLLALQA